MLGALQMTLHIYVKVDITLEKVKLGPLKTKAWVYPAQVGFGVDVAMSLVLPLGSVFSASWPLSSLTPSKPF